MGDRRATGRRVERTLARAYHIGDREAIITLRLRLETPGDCCVNLSTALPFTYNPPLPDDIAVRFDDRIYDGLYAGLADVEGVFPAEGLKVVVLGLRSEPSLAALLDDDWATVSQAGEALGDLARRALQAAWPAIVWYGIPTGG